MRDDGGVAGEGRVVGVPKFHLWDKCTLILTNINSNWMSKASSGLCIIYLFNYAGPLSCILGCNQQGSRKTAVIQTISVGGWRQARFIA